MDKVIEIKVIANDDDDPISVAEHFGFLLEEMLDNKEIKDFEVVV